MTTITDKTPRGFTTKAQAQEVAARTPGHALWDITDWRAAHSWLRGYSDAQLGKPIKPDGTWSPAAYLRGVDSARAQ